MKIEENHLATAQKNLFRKQYIWSMGKCKNQGRMKTL